MSQMKLCSDLGSHRQGLSIITENPGINLVTPTWC